MPAVVSAPGIGRGPGGRSPVINPPSLRAQSGPTPSGNEGITTPTPESNQYITTLAAAVNVGDQQIQVNDAPPQDLIGQTFRILIDDGLATAEWMLAYPQAGSTIWPVVRGVDGSTPQTHSQLNALSQPNPVYHVLTKGGLTQLLNQVLAATAQQSISNSQLPTAIKNSTDGALSGRKLCVIGHSQAEALGPKHGFTWPFKIARQLGAEEINYAGSGGICALNDDANLPTNPGGYASVFNAIIPAMPWNVTSPVGIPQRQMRNENVLLGGLSAAAAGGYNQGGGYVSYADIYIMVNGGNDMKWVWSDSITCARIFQGANEAVIARARAGAFFNDDSALLSYAGTWSTNAWGTTNGNSTKGSTHSTTVATSSATFTVPPSYDGGEIAFYWLVGRIGGVGMGGLITFTDSANNVLGTLDLSNSVVQRAPMPTSHTNSTSVAVWRCGGKTGIPVPVTGASQTIKATVTSFSGTVPTDNVGGTLAITGAAFDGITIEASIPPRVLLVFAPHPAPSAVAPTGGAPNASLSTLAGAFVGSDCLNASLQAMTQTPYWADGNVLVADLATWSESLTLAPTNLPYTAPPLYPYGVSPNSMDYPKPRSTNWYDDIHLNEYGHDTICRVIMDALSNGPDPLVNGASAAPTWRQVGINTVNGSAVPSLFNVTLSSPIASGSAITTIAATWPGGTIPANGSVSITSGTNWQTFAVNATSTSGTINVLSQLPNFAYPTTSVAQAVGPHAQVGAEPPYGTNWSAGSYTGQPSAESLSYQQYGAEFCKDIAGIVHLRGLVTNSSTPVAGSVIFQLPTYCRPAEGTGDFVCACIGKATLSSPLVTTAPITTLAVVGLPCFVPGGTQLVISSGTNVQVFRVLNSASEGATSLTIASVTPNFAYPTTSTIQIFGLTGTVRVDTWGFVTYVSGYAGVGISLAGISLTADGGSLPLAGQM